MRKVDEGKTLYHWQDLKNIKNDFEDTSDGYYHLLKDLENFPDCWCYVVYSRRGPGKTYSALWTHIYQKLKIIYMKRTAEDVDTIIKQMGNEEADTMSPYEKINKDKVLDVQPYSISKGLGAFYKNVNGEQSGKPISYILALNKIKTVKGIEASDCEWIVMDEFIPQAGEIVRHKEGEQLLDLYMTIIRDKVTRGGKEIKLILFANAEEISTPITNELDIVDDLAFLNNAGEECVLHLENRRMLIHHIVPEEVPKAKFQDDKLGIYYAMKDTAWGLKTFEGTFANNDFSNIKNMSIRKMKPLCVIINKKRVMSVYYNDDGFLYMSYKGNKNMDLVYDLNLENDQKKFYCDMLFTLREHCINGQMAFSHYSMYDLIMNFKKFYKV